MHFVSPSQLPPTHTFPPSLNSVVSGQRFWSLPPWALFPPPSLLPLPASLGFSFDTNL